MRAFLTLNILSIGTVQRERKVPKSVPRVTVYNTGVQVVVIAQIHNAWAVTPRQLDDRNIGMGLPVQQSDISHAQWLRGYQ